jgi:hypothetical protein
MAFFPMELFTCKINISKDGMIRRLNENVEPKNILYFTYCEKPFFGKIFENGFKIIKHSNYASGFHPIIIGNVIENSNDTTILKILLRPNLIALIFIFLSFGVPVTVLPILVFIDTFDINEKFISLVAIFIGLLFIVIGLGIFYSIMIFVFKHEVKQSKKSFDAIFDDEIIIEEENHIMNIIRYAIRGANFA